MSTLKLYLLGSPYLEKNGQPVEMDTRKALALLGYLTLAGAAQNRDSLAALLWPDYDESGARGAFRRTLSTLNKALGDGVLDINRERISMAAEAPLWVDVLEFRRLLASTGDHPHTRREVCMVCLPVLQQAASLYRGDFLAGFSLRDSASFDDWQAFQSEALRQELAGALERLAQGQAASADFSASLQTARRWLSLDPLNEPAHRLIMQLYEWSGQHGAALRQYRECLRVLEQQLGVTPLEETTRVYQAIQEQRLAGPQLFDWAAPPTQTPPGVFSANNSHTLPALTVASAAGRPLVGRAAEMDSLLRAYRTASRSGCFFALQGEAGIGKTRLAQEFMDQIISQGGLCLSAHCYEGEESLPFGPLVEVLRAAYNLPQANDRLAGIAPAWLAEAARLTPDSRLPGPPAGASDTPAAQLHFLEGLCQTLNGLCGASAGRPLNVLFFDDVHWADSATLDLLAYLVRRLPGSGIFLLVSWRADLVPTENGLRRLLADARRSGYGGDLNLARLPLEAVRELLTASLAARAEPGLLSVPALAEQLYQESEGLPFILVEYLENLADQARPDWALPQSVRDLIHARLDSVDETSRQLLTTAAVLGRSFEYEILRQASGRSEMETIGGLETLLRRGLVQERPTIAQPGEVLYDFSHEKLRRLVYEETSLARRRLLHLRVAEALAARLRQQRENAAQVAHHYQQAGQLDQAAVYFAQAGESARALYANQAAIAHFQNALACGHLRPAELHEALGDLFTLTGQYQSALMSYETAAALCAPARLGWLEHRLGNIHHRRGEWEMAECHFESAAQAFNESENYAEQARVFADWSRNAYRQGRLTQAEKLAARSLELASSSASQPALAQAYNILGLLERSRGNYSLAISHLEHSLEITNSLPDPVGRAAALNNLARACADGGDLPKAIELTLTALELCNQQGDRHHGAALLNNLADLYHAAGDAQNAMQHLKQAVTLFAEIGDQAGNLSPEIWMLAEW